MRNYQEHIPEQFRKTNTYLKRKRQKTGKSLSKAAYSTSTSGFPSLQDKIEKIYTKKKYRAKSRNPKAKKRKLVVVNRKRSIE